MANKARISLDQAIRYGLIQFVSKGMHVDPWHSHRCKEEFGMKWTVVTCEDGIVERWYTDGNHAPGMPSISRYKRQWVIWSDFGHGNTPSPDNIISGPFRTLALAKAAYVMLVAAGHGAQPG